MEKLYSISEAAKQLGGVSDAAVKAWIHRKRIQKTKVGRRTMIAESELQRFIAASGPTSHPQATQTESAGV